MYTVNAQVQQAWTVPFRYSGHSSLDHGNAVTVDANGNVYVLGPTAYGDGDESEDGMVTIKYDKHGVKLWSSRFPGRELFRTGPSIAVDADGNVYVAGRKERDVAPWAFPLEYVIVKYNSSGAVQWSHTYEGPRKRCLSVYMAIDAASNVYVTGASLSDQGEEADFYSPTDIATLKFDKDGNLKWTRRYNGAAPNDFDDAPGGMVVDASGNVYITGNSQKDCRIGCTTIKYNTDGTELWVQRYNATATSWDVGADIKMDASGNIYICSKNFTSSTTGETNISTLKYDNDGALQWVKQFDSGEDDLPGSIGIDGAGNVYVAGFSDQSSAFPSNYSLAILKYNNSGDEQWVKNYALNASSNPFFFDDQPDDHFARLIIGNDNNLYISTPIFVIGESYNYLTLKYDPGGHIVWTQQFNGASNLADYPGGITVDANNNVYVTGGSTVAGGNVDNFVTIKYTQCTLTCPADITVNNDHGQCGAVVNYPEAIVTGDCGSAITYSKASGSMFDIGTTAVTVTSTETGVTCSFNVTVIDNSLPVLICPTNKTVNVNAGVCYATVSVGLATATDNCPGVTVTGIRSDGLANTMNYPVGITVITWTATDASNNTVTCSQTITIVDNVPPTIIGESASTYVLSPPNHTVRDVTINYTATDNCAVTSVITVTSNEPINGVSDGDTDPDWIVVDNHHVKLRAERSAKGDGRIYTITITATDPSGNTSSKTLEVRVPHDIKNPNSGKAFIVNSTVPFEGEFWDKAGNSHSAKWLIDDNISVKGIVTEPVGNKNGKITGSYKFTVPGVYKLQMNITDQSGLTTYTNTAGDLEAIVVIYDPNGGNTYGGGYFNSPAGALRSNPSATGKASYGFAMNYFKNSTYPKGETQFEFKVGSFEFNALNFEYLVISNSMSQFKGTGKITGGQSGVGFTMTVIDGQLDGSGVDKIRMKIYNKNNGSIIYDNQFGASDAALPTQAVGANSTIVISGINSSLTSANTNQKAEMEATVPEVSSDLDVLAFPNPSTNNFTINVNAKANERITMQIVDMYGRIIETKNVTVNSLIRFGDRYTAGTYFVRVVQGKQHKEIKLIKLSD